MEYARIRIMTLQRRYCDDFPKTSLLNSSIQVCKTTSPIGRDEMKIKKGRYL